MLENRWLMLALLFLARTAMGFQFQSVGSVAPELADRLALEYSAIGTLIGLYLLPGVFIALPGGVLGERFAAKHIVVAGLAAMAAGGCIMAASTWFPALACGRLLSGTGAVLINVLITKMVADWFAGREIATAMAVVVTSWPVGIALGLLGFAPLAAAFGWPAVMYFSGIVCVPCLLAVAFLYRDPPTGTSGKRRRLELNLSAREWTLVSVAGLTWATYNVGYILLVSFLPGHLSALGYALPRANAIVSWLGWAMIVFVPAGGYFADRLGRPNLVMAGGFMVAGVAAIALATGAAPAIPSFAVIVIAIGLPVGPIMALPAAAVRAENRATGMGIYFTWYYALMATFPALAGFARDVTNNSGTPVLFAAGMMAAALAGVAIFWLLARNWVRSQAYARQP